MENEHKILHDVVGIPVINISNSQLMKQNLVLDLKQDRSGDQASEKIEDSIPEVANKIDRDEKVSKDVIYKLSSGLLSLYVGDLHSMSNNLSELIRNQTILIETIQQENARFTECQNMYNLDDLFSRVKYYHAKLQHIKKEMTIIHDRSAKLKKRALKLQQLKQKEALQREQQREREIEKEKHLIPKVSTKT